MASIFLFISFIKYACNNTKSKLIIEKATIIFTSWEVYEIEVVITQELQKIHKSLFDGLYPSIGEIRTYNISISGFRFANSL